MGEYGKNIPDEHFKPRSEPSSQDAPFDLIPPGTFYSGDNDELTKERIFAIRMVEERGREIADQHPEVIGLYKDPSLRLIDIAYMVFPKEEVDRYPQVLQKAVGFAIRLLNPQEEQADLTRLHRQHRIEMTFDFSSPEFIEQCKRASQRRHEVHGVDADAMVRGRGREPWSIGEKLLLNELIVSPNFIRTEGSQAGHPNYELVVAELNRLYHEGQEVRTVNSTMNMVQDFRRRKPPLRPDTGEQP